MVNKLRPVRSHIGFCETDEPEKPMSWLPYSAYCATESAGLEQAQRRIRPMRRAAAAVSG
jgi:hypothetical protein